VVYYGKIKSYKIMPTMPEVGPNWLKKKGQHLDGNDQSCRGLINMKIDQNMLKYV
jgi:hypothetical protein